MAPPPEIAIPSTSISDEHSSKPYTLYNITLRLPLRSFVVQKRYSDFDTLHKTLVEQVGAAPPEPLPGKHWLKSTVKSVDLTRDRQVGLERYLKAIAETPDRRWRDTSAWRAFLNLPSSSTTNSAVSAKGTVSSRLSGAADPGTWLDMHRELKQSLHEARQSLQRRDGAVDSGNNSAAAEAGAAAKKSIVKAGQTLIILTDGIKKMTEAKRLGDGELRRRRDMLSAARMEKDGLEKLSNSMFSAAAGAYGASQGQPSASDKAKLLAGGKPANPRGRVLGAPAQETQETRARDNEGLLQLNKDEMALQDKALDQLTAVVQRQKEIGLQINEEITLQNEMLDQLDQDVDRVNAKVGVANKRVKRLGK